ncbi:MAG TPA: ASPIC/UnbV domain-containing protein, partial [Verrucomicrobiota bacterium]|nr:ASPIC/UnbV domain-containing protein [Verrucomicrobiota bacterium]
VVSPPGGTQPVLLGASRGAAFGDLDNDGTEDVVVVNKDGPVHLLRNVAPRRGGWLGLDVRDARGRVARNALVRVASRGTQWRQVQPNEGYASSNDPRLVFGLGGAAAADQVLIQWADGVVREFGPLAGARYHLIDPAGGRPAPTPW